MKGIKFMAAASVVAASIVAGAAVANAGVGLHWYQGNTPSYSLTYNGDGSASVSASGQVAGAGTYITAVLTVNYSVPTTCWNGGADSGPVPGKTVSGSVTSDPVTTQANHGNATFNVGPVTVSPPSSVDPATVCKNHGNGWTATVGPLTVTSATVSVTSNNGGSITDTHKF